MTLHTPPIELKDAAEAPEAIVTKALNEHLEALEQRAKTFEQKYEAATEKSLKTLQELGERVGKVEAKANRPAGKTEPTDDQPIEVKAFNRLIRSGPDHVVAEERKALVVADDTSGGYLAPAQFTTDMIREITEFSPVRQAARVGSTGSGSVIRPKRTSITNAKWEGETEESEESTLAFGQNEIFVHEMRTFTDISVKLLEDSAVDVEAELRAAFGEDFGQKEATAFVNGTGVKQPKGFMANTEIAETPNGHATNLSADALIKLMYALQASYRNRGVWMMNSTSLATIRTLKDGQGNFLWQPSFQAGQPETILGRPVVEAIDMPDIASNAYPIIYGDFAGGYQIYDRVGLTVLRDPYSQAGNGLVRFHARRRVGGDVIQASRFRKLKMATS
ncbi:MAG: phage major capsid protein [Pseudomonadota bacterium]